MVTCKETTEVLLNMYSIPLPTCRDSQEHLALKTGLPCNYDDLCSNCLSYNTDVPLGSVLGIIYNGSAYISVSSCRSLYSMHVKIQRTSLTY